jgi:spermidine/putrescine transport system ATP-binding protein
VSLGEARISAITFQGSFKRVLAESLAVPGLTFIARTGPEERMTVGAACNPSCRLEDIMHLAR